MRIDLKTVILAVLLSVAIGTVAHAVHDKQQKVKCLDCHRRLPFGGGRLVFNESSEEVCIGCHRNYHGSGKRLLHPVRVVPSMKVPRDMPLDSGGRITCFTCHTYHLGYTNADGERLFFLRRVKGKTFCYSCHKRSLTGEKPERSE